MRLWFFPGSGPTSGGRGAGFRGCRARAADLPWSLLAAGGAASSLRILHPDCSRPACGLACAGVLRAACTQAPVAPGLVHGAASRTAPLSPLCPSGFGTSQQMLGFPLGLASLQWRTEFLIIEKLCDRPGIKGSLSSSWLMFSGIRNFFFII